MLIYREESSAPPSGLPGPSRLGTFDIHQHLSLLGEGFYYSHKGG